jgi:hypothetical protein
MVFELLRNSEHTATVTGIPDSPYPWFPTGLSGISIGEGRR